MLRLWNRSKSPLATLVLCTLALQILFSLHPYLIQTLSKWSSKIQAVAPSVLLPSTRGTLLKGNQSLRSVVQIIDETLSDHDKLLTRTQIMRGKKRRIGASEEDDLEAEDTPDPEIFDDSDFYQKMLRNIIDARGDGGKTEDWMLLQKQKKAKKKVDTKASKGRKLRFVIPSNRLCSSDSLFLLVTRSMQKCKTLWYQSLYLVHGMTNRLMNCLRHCLEEDLRILASLIHNLGLCLWSLRDSESLASFAVHNISAKIKHIEL